MTDERQRVLVGDHVHMSPRGAKGIWTADFHFRGTHRRKSLKTRDQKIAHKLAKALDKQISAGELSGQRGQPQKVSLAAAIAAFIAYHETEGSRPNTRKKYKGVLRIFAEFCTSAGIQRLDEVELVLIDRYRAFRKPGLSPNSMSFEGALLKSFLRWCLERGWIAANPLAHRRFVTPKRGPRECLTLAEVNSILATAPESRLAVWALLAFTGMRSGEAQRLRPQDVDFKNNWIRIESREGAETKTGDSRKVPLHPRLRAILDSLPKTNRPWFFTAQPSPKYPNGDHHISTKRINEDLLQVLQRLGLPAGRDTGGHTVHSFRHFFRTFTVNARVPERIVDQWLGHAPDKSMGSVYYHLDDPESQQFMRELRFDENSSS